MVNKTLTQKTLQSKQQTKKTLQTKQQTNQKTPTQTTTSTTPNYEKEYEQQKEQEQQNYQKKIQNINNWWSAQQNYLMQQYKKNAKGSTANKKWWADYTNRALRNIDKEKNKRLLEAKGYTRRQINMMEREQQDREGRKKREIATKQYNKGIKNKNTARLLQQEQKRKGTKSLQLTNKIIRQKRKNITKKESIERARQQEKLYSRIAAKLFTQQAINQFQKDIQTQTPIEEIKTEKKYEKPPPLTIQKWKQNQNISEKIISFADRMAQNASRNRATGNRTTKDILKANTYAGAALLAGMAKGGWDIIKSPYDLTVGTYKGSTDIYKQIKTNGIKQTLQTNLQTAKEMPTEIRVQLQNTFRDNPYYATGYLLGAIGGELAYAKAIKALQARNISTNPLHYIRKTTGKYTPNIITTTNFPRELRPESTKRLKAKDIDTFLTGSGVREKHVYVGKPKYAGTQGTKTRFVTQGLDVGKNRKIYMGGEVFVNPSRNPTYWKNILDNKKVSLGKRIKKTITKGKLKNPNWTIIKAKIDTTGKATQKNLKSFYKSKTKITRGNNIPDYRATTAPKTIRKYEQPEMESVLVGKEGWEKELRKVYIGKDKLGQKVYYDIPKETGIKGIINTKAKARIESWKNQWYAKDNYAKATSILGKQKLRRILKKDPLGNIVDNSGRTHIQRIKNIARKEAKKYGVKINTKLTDAFADLHDIYKQPNYNYKIDKAISHGLDLGYYNDIPSIKKLNTQEKKQLKRLILLDEKPPINKGNLRKRLAKTIEYAPHKLTPQEKIIINSDRLARFGKKADPDMIFDIAKIKNEKIRKAIKKESIQKSGKISKKAEAKLKKEAKEYEELYENIYKKEAKRNKYNKYAKYEKKTKQYTNRKYDYNKVPKNHLKETYTYNKIKPIIPTYENNYTKEIPPPYTGITTNPIQPYTTLYGTTATGKNTITIPLPTPPRKTGTKTLNYKIKNKKIRAWKPILYDNTGNRVYGEPYSTYEEAVNAGMYQTDKTQFHKFNIRAVRAELEEIQTARKFRQHNKFIRKGNDYIEKRYYRYDTKREKKGNFNILPYVFKSRE